MGLSLAIGSIATPAPKHAPAYEDPPPEWLIENVIRWLPLVHRWHPEYSELDPAWVLGVIAQESQGFPHLVAEDIWGSTGLMQVGPRSWTGTRNLLKNPAFNIMVGMRMLSSTLEKTDGDIRRAMGAYNCGFVGLDAGKCGSRGGYAYSDKILEVYVPVFRAELIVRAGADDLIGNWLDVLGYRDGLGNWDSIKEKDQEEKGCRIELPRRRFRPAICLD